MAKHKQARPGRRKAIGRKRPGQSKNKKQRAKTAQLAAEAAGAAEVLNEHAAGLQSPQPEEPELTSPRTSDEFFKGTRFAATPGRPATWVLFHDALKQW